jgi:hypothetical protein
MYLCSYDCYAVMTHDAMNQDKCQGDVPLIVSKDVVPTNEDEYDNISDK